MVRAFILSIILVIIFVGGFAIAHFGFDYKISFYTYGDGNFLWGSKKKTIINVALVGEPKSLDPQKVYTMPARIILYDIFEGLMQHDASGKAVLGLAESYQVSDDGCRYVFTLRNDIMWSNGTKITANDFVSTYERLLNSKNSSPYSYLLYPVIGAEDYHLDKVDFKQVGIKAENEKTLVITLDHPVNYFLESLSHFALSVINVDNLNSLTDKPTLEVENILTSGAYKLNKSTSKGIITAVKNNNYYAKDSVKISKINYYVTSNQTLIIKGYRAKYIDLVRSFSTNYLQSLKNGFSDEVKTYPMLGVSYIAFNLNKNQTIKVQEKNLRAALNMIVQRENFFISQDSFLENPAYSLINSQVILGYKDVVPYWKIMSTSKRKEAALMYITDLGYSSTNTLNLKADCIIGNDLMNLTSSIIKGSFDYYPITLDLETKDCNILKKDDKKYDFDLSFETVVANYMDPSAILNVVRYGRYGKYSGVNNITFTSKLESASKAIDQISGYMNYEEAENVLNSDSSIIPLYYLYAKNLVSSTINGWQDNSLDIHPIKYLHFYND